MSPRPAPSNHGEATRIRPNPRRFLWIAACGLVVIAAAIYVWQTRTLPIQALSVQPFTPEAGPDVFSAAISEEIADILRPVTKPSADPMHSAVLQGTVSRSGDRVRVVARLTRGDGHHYWTRTIERPLPEIAREVAAAIAPFVRKKAPRRQPTIAAYDKFLEGRSLFARGDFAKAVDAFDDAAGRDSEFARAFAWAALARESLADQGAVRANDLLPAARDNAERAATLAPDSPEAHLALAIVKLQYDWDWDAARREFDRALQLSPAHPLAVLWNNRWLAAMNRAPAFALEVPDLPRDPDHARQLLAQADELRAQAYVTPLRFALAAQAAQDPDNLFHWLDVAYDERCVQLPSFIRNPALPQSDPRLQQLIRRLKLPTNP